jgi:7,8-dihydroneopterin aldolase/epimerase/oxygenase
MRVFVKNLEFTGRHGVYEEERRDGRRFQVDLSAVLGDLTSGESDVLDDTLDYRELAQIVLEFGHGDSRILVERLAHEIVAAVLERFPRVIEASVTIRKFATGVPGEPECVGVELTRRRDF